jgi:hypothetical protein
MVNYACVVKDIAGRPPLDNQGNAGYIGASDGKETTQDSRMTIVGSNEVEVRWHEVK